MIQSPDLKAESRRRVDLAAFDDASDLQPLLREQRRGRQRSAPSLKLYYRLKPAIPRKVLLRTRRAYARRVLARQKAGRGFPRWPLESVLVDRQQTRFRDALIRAGRERVGFVDFWPDRRRFAFVLTHDVEGTIGAQNVRRVREIERRHGMVSSWNFVAEAYRPDLELFEELRQSGCEIGLHGLTHDGKLFEDRAQFDAHLPRIHHYLHEWGADGFRSPATYRNADWMQELGCLYDSSFPDTDPFEPQPGGCCSIFPFFLGDLVELPITMPQDHTLFEVLQEDSIRLWVHKAEWLIRHHGLVNVLVHPDYLISEDRLALYDQLLAFMSSQSRGWHALPREVARWWRARADLESSAVSEGGVAEADLARHGATVSCARLGPAGVVFGPEAGAVSA